MMMKRTRNWHFMYIPCCILCDRLSIYSIRGTHGRYVHAAISNDFGQKATFDESGQDVIIAYGHATGEGRG
jgi:hypothetical protein